ncbi:tetratricopeptide repeat-containing sulfotransferase family protein [Phenylobacterium sp.]|uniref:tetratricopeptide repeat-containing sulfotransferase family protein n=1 Tax=Phenylobacterium sp. TaxID=1871053 RepID=UPI0025F50532|nr:tetratricopeptide repeat-containing sulfotransferase family protein [Phenylobacterium sp.]
MALEHAARLLPLDAAAAEEQAREILRAVGEEPQALRLLGAALRRQGETEAAEAAYLRSVKASVSDPELVRAAAALCENRLAVAEQTLRGVLMQRPTDVAAIRMLAETGMRLGRYDDAEKLLARCVELAPGFSAARHNYATVLYRQNKPVAAIAEVDRLLAEDPANPGYRNLKAAALGRIGEFEAAIELYGSVVRDQPRQPKVWMSLGHALKTVGRQAEAIDAYRRCVALAPQFGEAWWSLANLKTVRFSDADVAAMEGQLRRADLSEEDRFHLEFALGKAREDEGAFEASFGHYARGNALRREGLDYDADETRDQVRRAKALLAPAFLAARAGQGCPAADPIFVVGLPRAGSTLVEQILASHSQVEGTQELPDIISLARRLGGRAKRASEGRYPEVLADLGPDDLAALGAEYLERARPHRKLGRAFFIDKMPNNWAHVGLIHLILPNAKIVDARRHPMGCGFSGFKQHFARGQGFTYDLTDIGRYYADYVDLMAHVDRVLPGRVHRVIYERMVADPESETRALLAHCGLPFEEACLRFYENDRAVRTASSEQVRRPIFTDAADHWRNYEPWLGPLKAALGDVLTAYPEAPGGD